MDYKNLTDRQRLELLEDLMKNCANKKEAWEKISEWPLSSYENQKLKAAYIDALEEKNKSMKRLTKNEINCMMEDLTKLTKTEAMAAIHKLNIGNLDKQTLKREYNIRTSPDFKPGEEEVCYKTLAASRVKKTKHTSIKPLIILFAVAALFIAFAVMANSGVFRSTPSPSYSNASKKKGSTSQTASGLKTPQESYFYGSVQQTPENGKTRNLTESEAVAPFEVTTPNDGQYYYVVLKDSTTGEKAYTLFLYSDTTKEVKVPYGTYDVYVAAGKSWQGEEKLFGEDGYYFAANRSIEFTEINGKAKGIALKLSLAVGRGEGAQSAIEQSEFLQ